MDLFVLKTDGEKFTSTNEKTLHLIFKLVGKLVIDYLLVIIEFIASSFGLGTANGNLSRSMFYEGVV